MSAEHVITHKVATLKSAVSSSKKTAATDTAAQKKAWTRMRASYAYYGQLSNILLGNLAQMAEGTKALSVVQGAQAIQTAVMGEIAVYQVTNQMLGAIASGNYLGATALGVIAASLQTSIVDALASKYETDKAAQQADAIRLQIEAYQS